jgi:hypothetical protein
MMETLPMSEGAGKNDDSKTPRIDLDQILIEGYEHEIKSLKDQNDKQIDQISYLTDLMKKYEET